MQPVDGLGACGDELVAAISEQLERDHRVVAVNLVQPVGAQRGQGDRVRVDRVGLAAVAGGEHPHPRGHPGVGVVVGMRCLDVDLELPIDEVNLVIGRPVGVGVRADVTATR